MATKIRAMRRADKRRLMDILRRTPQFKPGEVLVAEEVIDSCLKDGRHSGYNTLVAEDENGPAGYICYGPTPLTEDTWDVYWEAVAPERQGRGIGGALMEAAEKEIRRARGRLILIETSSTPSYEKTRRFYENHGYEIISHIPDFYTPGDDRLILRKKLGQDSSQTAGKVQARQG